MSWPRFGHEKKWKRRESCVREISWPESCVCLCETHSNRKAESLLVVPALIMHVCAFAFPVKLETAIAWEVAARPLCASSLHSLLTTPRSIIAAVYHQSLRPLSLPLHSFFNHASLSRSTTTPATTIMNH
jgi:hypothetical protein